jgi:hypothetical protein
LKKPIFLLEEFPDVWAEKGSSSMARNHVPIMVNLKLGALPVRKRQYPVPQEAYLGNQTHLQWMKDAEKLIKCQLPWNTPELPIKKAGEDDYHPVQDLWAVNNTVITLHPVVPNLYTLLRLLPSQESWFTCLDLKDVFFCLFLAPVRQPLFAFEWDDPHTRRKTQMTWTRQPQRLKNSPTFFREALTVNLSPSQKIIQIVLCSTTWIICSLQATTWRNAGRGQRHC